MVEPEGRAGQEEASQTGPLLEGEQVSRRPAAGAAPSDRLPVFRAGVDAAGDLGPESLDMLAALDEPELLMGVLKRFADRRLHSEKWAIVAEAAQYGINALQKANEPRAVD